MKSENYILSLLPSFEKVQIKEDLRNLKEELDNNTLPPFKAATGFFTPQYDIKSKWLKEFDGKAKRKMKFREKNIILAVNNAVINTSARIEVLLDMIDKHYSDDIVRDGLTYLKVNILQYIESLTFLTEYANKLLLVAYASETAKFGGEWNKSNSRDMKYLEARYDDFLVVLRVQSIKPKELKAKLDDVPDMVVDAKTAPTVRESVGIMKVDPFSFGLISVSLNPIYHVRMAITRYRVSRMRKAASVKTLLEFKLLHLRNQKEGKKDAKLEELIERYQAQVDKIEFELQEFVDE